MRAHTPSSNKESVSPTTVWRLTGYLLLAGSSLHASATAKVLHGLCPAAIKASSVKLVDIPSEWIVDIPAGLRWQGAAVLSSPTSKKVFLEPETYQTTQNIWVDKYILGKPDAEGNWISCSYGDNNGITLSKRIDDAFRECIVTYRKMGSTNTLIDATCK